MDINSIEIIIAGAVLTQFIVEAIKPLFKENKQLPTLPAIISLLAGLLISIGGGLDLPASLGISLHPIAAHIVTGILIARGSNFVHDLLSLIQSKCISE